MHRWDEGFTAVRDAFLQSQLDYLGDTEAMFSPVLRLSEDDARLQSRINTLVDLYQQAAEEYGYRGPEQRSKRLSFSNVNSGDDISLDNHKPKSRVARPMVNPLTHLADGLVKSLVKIDADRVTHSVLESDVVAVEQWVTKCRDSRSRCVCFATASAT